MKGFKYIGINYTLFINNTIKVIISIYINNFKIISFKGSKYILLLKKALSK